MPQQCVDVCAYYRAAFLIVVFLPVVLAFVMRGHDGN